MFSVLLVVTLNPRKSCEDVLLQPRDCAQFLSPLAGRNLSQSGCEGHVGETQDQQQLRAQRDSSRTLPLAGAEEGTQRAFPLQLGWLCHLTTEVVTPVPGGHPPAGEASEQHPVSENPPVPSTTPAAGSAEHDPGLRSCCLPRAHQASGDEENWLESRFRAGRGPLP